MLTDHSRDAGSLFIIYGNGQVTPGRAWRAGPAVRSAASVDAEATMRKLFDRLRERAARTVARWRMGAPLRFRDEL